MDNIKKIIWLSNAIFSSKGEYKSRTWLQPLAEELSHYYEVVNITKGTTNNKIERSDCNNIKQYILPNNKEHNFNMTASVETAKKVQYIINNENPSIVHIWGTETIWASIYYMGYIKYPTLLDIQGLLFKCYKYFNGGLSFKERIKCLTLKEFLLPVRSIQYIRYCFKQRSKYELIYLKSFENISYQSEWVKYSLENKGIKARFFKTNIILRNRFYESEFKNPENKRNNILFTSASSAIPYKGLHDLIKAMAIIKRNYPNIQLWIAGDYLGGILNGGYVKLILSLIHKYNLENNIKFLGLLDEENLISTLLLSDINIISSYVETYSLALAEAMILGVPSVVSYSCAMTELAENNKDVIFYTPGDIDMCAMAIEKLLANKSIYKSLSISGRNKKKNSNNKIYAVRQQIEIYKEIQKGDQTKIINQINL